MANVDVVLYLGEQHPKLRYRQVTLTATWAGSGSTQYTIDPAQAVWATVSDIPEGLYLVEVRTVLSQDCKIFPNGTNIDTISFRADCTPGIKDYCGKHNCPRVVLVCASDEILESDSSASSVSESSRSSSSSRLISLSSQSWSSSVSSSSESSSSASVSESSSSLSSSSNSSSQSNSSSISSQSISGSSASSGSSGNA